MVEVDAERGVVRVVGPTASVGNALPIIDDMPYALIATRNMSFWHQCLSTIGHYLYAQDFGIGARNEIVSLTHGGTHTDTFISPRDSEAYGAAILAAVDSDEKIRSLKVRYEEFAVALTRSLDDMRQDLTVGSWRTFLEAYARMCAGLNLTAILGRVGVEALIEQLRGKGLDEAKIPEVISVITYPSEHTPLFESQLGLLRIGKDVQDGKSDEHERAQALEAWLARWRHIPVNFCEDPWTIRDAHAQLESILAKECAREVRRLEEAHQAKIAQAKQRLADLEDARIAVLARALAEGTYLNEFRKSVFSKVSLGYRPVFETVARLGGSDQWRDCLFLLPDEMTQLLEGRKLSVPTLVRERSLAGCKLAPGGSVALLDAAELKRLEEYVKVVNGQTRVTSEDRMEVKGFSASKGKVRGIVRIVLSSKDFHKLGSGEILVTTMTSVDFVPVMERAGAFVTNEGGITSYASIVARELGKPCIIGTKIATQVLKDGDMVEVDAEKGIVRILE